MRSRHSLTSTFLTLLLPIGAAGMWMCTTKAAHANLITNGSFESDYTGWSYTGNQEIHTKPKHHPSDRSKLVTFNAGQATPNGVLSQAFPTAVGQPYLLRFDLGANAYQSTAEQRMQMTVQGNSVLVSQTHSVFGPGYGTRYTPQALFFVANSSRTTLTFQDVSPATVNIDLVLDNVAVTTPNAPSLLRVNTENPRYFMDQTGKAVYLTGSHVWLNLQDLSHYPPFDNTAYLNMMVANGHNFIRLWTLDESNIILYPDGFRNNVTPIPFTRPGPGTAADGGLKVDLAQLSQDYFDRLRARVIEAHDRGIYVSIMLFNGLWIDGPDSTQFTYSYFNPANNVSGPAVKKDDLYTMNNSTWVAYMDAYIDKVIDTVNDLDNVLYEVSNETTVKSKSWQYRVIDRIHAREAGKPKRHPVGITAFSLPSGGESNNQYLYASNAEWVSIFGNVNYTTNIPDAPPTKVEILDTDHVWGLDPPGDDSPWVWKSLTRGHNPIYMDPYTYASSQPPDASPRTMMRDARNLARWIRKSLRRGQNPTDISGHPPDVPLRAAMGYSRRLAERIDLNHMVPNDALASTGYVLANPNAEYLVYQPSKAAFTVNLPADIFSYEWICPNTGATTDRGNFTSTAGTRTFALPDGCNSALLYLKKQ